MIVKCEKCETSFYTPSARAPHSHGDDKSQPETKMQSSVGKPVRTLKIIAGCALLGARISMSRSVLTGQVYHLTVTAVHPGLKILQLRSSPILIPCAL